MEREPKHTWLVQRLLRPPKSESFLFGKDNPFAFGGGLVNGGFSKEAMDLLRPIFSWDYMGAAEFEFGAVPEALNRMVKSDKLTFSEIQLTAKISSEWDKFQYLRPRDDNGYWLDMSNAEVIKLKAQAKKSPAIVVKHPIYYLVPTWLEKYCQAHIQEDLAEKWQGKEHSGLLQAFTEFPKNRVIGWLELNNGFFFFIDREAFAKTVKLFTNQDIGEKPA